MLTLGFSSDNDRASRTVHKAFGYSIDCSVRHIVELTGEQSGDLFVNGPPRDCVHAAAGALEATIPCGERLAVSKRSADSLGTALLRPVCPPNATLAIRPAVHQSPEPQASAKRGAATALR